jgi:ElaB/YqjD/DUF883 family membrane-anchored ribosome-binding protein
MINQQSLQDNWNEITCKLRSKWGQLTHEDLQAVQGNIEQLVALIQRQTGEARDAIEHFLERVTSNGSATVGRAAEATRDYAHQVIETVQARSKQAAESVRTRFDQAEETVRQRPAESMVVCFGVGMVVGALLGLTLRNR